MSGVIAVQANEINAMVALPQPGHALGNVADDWEAAEVWLRAVARKNKSGSTETIDTYRFHIAKLRWYCEHVGRVTPSRWSMQDVDGFRTFLGDLPFDALCAKDGKRFVTAGESGYTPFRQQPAAGSQSDIVRCVHAMFKAWQTMGYIRINPMGMEGAGSKRSVNARRAIDVDLYQLVLQTLEREPIDSAIGRQKNLRDCFILVALRELGLRASELVGASMGAFYQLSDPKSKQRYWVFLVTAETGKGGKARRIPVTPVLLAALASYRISFGLPGQVAHGESTSLLLSPYTATVMIGPKPVRHAADRRYFEKWKELTTRQHLYAIVKERLIKGAHILRIDGRVAEADELAKASPHWLRHTFAKGALLNGQTMREVAGLLGHASVDTTMIYTEQDALDLIRAYERDGVPLAREAANNT